MKKKFSFKKIIIPSIIVLMVLIGILFALNNNKNKELETSDVEFKYLLKPEEEVEKLSDNIILANNSYKFFKNYYRKIDAKDIQENWDNFVRVVVPEYTQNISSSTELEEYYNSKKEDILVATGINNINDFEKLIKKVTSNYTQELYELKSIEILEESQYANENKTTKCSMKAIYDDENEIEFDFYVYNEIDDNGVFIKYE